MPRTPWPHTSLGAPDRSRTALRPPRLTPVAVVQDTKKADSIREPEVRPGVPAAVREPGLRAVQGQSGAVADVDHRYPGPEEFQAAVQFLTAVAVHRAGH